MGWSSWPVPYPYGSSECRGWRQLGALSSNHRCTVGDPLSQCTADDNQHFVWIEANLESGLATRIEESLSDDYDSINGILATRVTTQAGVDVKVFDGNYTGVELVAWTTCSSEATFGGSGTSRWCRPQIVYFNNGFFPRTTTVPQTRSG